MEYIIEPNPVIFWASVVQWAGILLMMAAFLAKWRLAFVIASLLSALASFVLADGVMVAAIAICVFALWNLAGKNAKKPGSD